MNYTAVCQAYRSNDLHRQELANLLSDVKFTDAIGNLFEFKDRQGVSSYRFNNIEKGTFGGANYIPVLPCCLFQSLR